MPRPVSGAFGCAGFRASRPSRREVIRIGGLAGAGLSLPDLLRARAAAAPDAGRPTRPSGGPAPSS